MNVSLPPELERLVQERARAGKYSDASEVVREGLEFFFAHEAELKGPRFFAKNSSDLESKLASGVMQLNEGRGVSADVARAQLEANAKARRQK